MLEKLEKFFVKVLEAEEIADKAAGGDGAVLNRAGGARETGEIFRQSAEAKAEAEENAAVLEILEKNGAFDEVADNPEEENAAVLEILEKNGAFANFLSEAEEIAGNFTEEDETEERAGVAREAEEIAEKLMKLVEKKAELLIIRLKSLEK